MLILFIFIPLSLGLFIMPATFNNMKMMSRGILFVCLLVLPSAQIYMTATSRPSCFTIEEEAGKEVKFFYQVFGANPESTIFSYEYTSGQGRKTIEGAKGQHSFFQATVNICFSSNDGSSKSVSVDFYTHDKAHLNQLASKSDIYELHDTLIKAGERMKEVKTNEIFEEERQSIHGKIIEDHESNLRYLVVAKLLVIVAAALGQLYLIKSLLNKQSQGYQPV